MGVNVYRKKEFTAVNFPKILFLGLLLISLVASLVISQKKQITVVIDNQERTIVTFMSKTENILKNNDIAIGSKDKISVSLGGTLKNGDMILIKRAVGVNLMVEEDNHIINTAESTVNKFLEEEGIILGELDKINVSMDQKITSGMSIEITRVSKIEQLQKEAIGFKIIEKPNNKMIQGERKIISPGVNGEKEILKELTMENFEVVNEKSLEEKILTEPKDEIVEVGTLVELEIPNGEKVYYSSIVPVLATAYTGDFNPQGVRDDPYAGKTAVGTWAKRDPNGISTVAVDPRVIPLGTKVYVEGYGLAIAEDVGGAIKGNRLDVFFYTYPETIKWGVRNVKVYILENVQKN